MTVCKHVWWRKRRHGLPFGPSRCRRCGATKPVGRQRNLTRRALEDARRRLKQNEQLWHPEIAKAILAERAAIETTAKTVHGRRKAAKFLEGVISEAELAVHGHLSWIAVSRPSLYWLKVIAAILDRGPRVGK